MNADPGTQLAHLQQLVRHPGWPVLCERFAKGIAEMSEQILDPNTDDLTATRLRHSRAVAAALSPDELAKGLETTLKKAVQKAADTKQQSTKETP